jgi:hypothetical protein
MKIENNILDRKITKVIYSEINHHNGKFYFNGFDTFDHSINIQMENEYWWNLSWKDDEYFEFGEGYFDGNKHIEQSEIKSWESTERWKKVLNSKVSEFKTEYIDDAELIINKIILEFENGEIVNILIAPELNENGMISHPLEYDFGGEIYVFYDEKLLKTK